VVLIYISFMARDSEHFFLFFSHWTSSFEKALFGLFAHFFVGSLIFWEFSFLNSTVYSDYQFLV
jgi:hypothetical protein